MAELEKKCKEHLTLEEHNEIELYALQLGSGLANSANDDRGKELSQGDIAQLTFEKLINSNYKSCQKLLSKPPFLGVVRKYRSEQDRVDELRVEMDRMSASNPIESKNLENQVNRLKYSIRAVKYKNNVLNQLAEN